ncbi:MAG: DUF4037 domain-containing protein [Chloroflexota bacterium]
MDERNQIVSSDMSHHETVDYWGASDYIIDAKTGIHVDFMYFRTDFMQEQIERVLLHHQAQMGYSTAFWHTVQQSLSIYDRNDWFTQLQTLSQQPYPDALVKNIITLNMPLLADIATSYKAQILKAIERNDVISLNHRVTAFLASYFDILFAINRRPHPGEKRLMQFALQCDKQPHNMQTDVMMLLNEVAQPQQVPTVIDALVENLKELVENEVG